MRIHLTVFISVSLVLFFAVDTSFSGSPEDLDGSGEDLESSASGSGDWWDEAPLGEKERAGDVQTSAENMGDGTMNPSADSFTMNYDDTEWPSESGSIIFDNSRSFLENKEILSAVTAGGITGAALAVAVAALFIYRWQKKEDEKSILGRQISSEEDYYRKYKDEFVVV